MRSSPSNKASSANGCFRAAASTFSMQPVAAASWKIAPGRKAQPSEAPTIRPWQRLPRLSPETARPMSSLATRMNQAPDHNSCTTCRAPSVSKRKIPRCARSSSNARFRSEGSSRSGAIWRASPPEHIASSQAAACRKLACGWSGGRVPVRSKNRLTSTRESPAWGWAFARWMSSSYTADSTGVTALPCSQAAGGASSALSMLQCVAP